MQKLPIGIQTFREIIEDDYIYIDKTKEVYELINSYKYTFLSRPRRFGKSLFLDTLRNIFEGNKELFKGLYIYDKWEFEKHPVIKISWAGDFTTLESLKIRAFKILKENQENLGVVCDDVNDAGSCLDDLIKRSYAKYQKRVVVLIDEYDKPILDAIENIEQAKINREFIKSLYTILKNNDEYIKFAFLTGVSKFSKASIFSGLNMLTDISLNPKYGNICGYTQNDIETTFKPYLENVDLEAFKSYYNGYNFLKDDIYNPFDTLLFIDNGCMYKNYWFETGTPTFLIKLIKEQNYFLPNLSNLVVDERLVNSFDIENLDVEVILYQAGYLTIDEMIIEEDEEFTEIEYKLKLPNKEVKISLNEVLIRYLTDANPLPYRKSLRKALKQADLEAFKDSLISIFASIPYNNYTKNKIHTYEGFYASIIYIYLQSLGIEVIGEDVTNKGRIDLTIKLTDKIYIIEFKVGKDNGKALQQIKQKSYHQKYLNTQLFIVGIFFSEEEKNIVSFEWEKIK